MRLSVILALLFILPVAAEETTAITDVPCTNGRAAGYPCNRLDLAAFISVAELGDANGTTNDVWGWTDPENGNEYALVGMSSGIVFVNVTRPSSPHVVGRLRTQAGTSFWRGVKVYRNHAYVIADRVGVHGMQVFDLTSLRHVPTFYEFQPKTVYYGPGLGLRIGSVLTSAHNIAVNEESGFAYVVGDHGTCSGGLHMIDIRTPDRPRFAGCFSADGYTHDVQCVTYRGPDPDHRNREICMASNEDTLTVVDVTDKRKPRMLSRNGYQNAGYAHQGWFTDDQQYFLMNDETDEARQQHKTRTIIWDVRDLDRPVIAGYHFAQTDATDHNLYVRGTLVYQANYRAGLRVLGLDDVAAGRLNERAYFDVFPENDDRGFNGAWSVYPFFASGTILVTSIETGIFVLRPAASLTAEETP